MKITPLRMVFFYAIMGSLFLYLAIVSVKDTIWHWHTILLMLIATFDFGVAIRSYLLHQKIKEIQEKKK
ncbi:YdiK family protein [Sutcliffiella horikoshii]|uniref:YdiK family protein n=1 Tax=Sutcliffiella horikoshii TaxID=79883 RepID=UPI00384F45C6